MPASGTVDAAVVPARRMRPACPLTAAHAINAVPRREIRTGTPQVSARTPVRVSRKTRPVKILKSVPYTGHVCGGSDEGRAS